MLRGSLALALLLTAAFAETGRAQPPEPPAPLPTPPAGGASAKTVDSEPKNLASDISKLEGVNGKFQGNEILKVFDLKHLDAGTAAEMLQSLFEPSELTVVADQRLGDLVVRGNAQVLDEVEVLLLRLDEPAASTRTETDTAQKPIDLSPADRLAKIDELYRALKTLQSTGQTDRESTASIDSLRQQLQGVEDHAVRAAERARWSPNAEFYEANMIELRRDVTNAFSLRQAIERAEVRQFLARLLQVSRTIELREEAASEIIERRIREMLDTNLGGPADGSANRAAAASGKSLPKGATNSDETATTPSTVEKQTPRFSVSFQNVRDAKSIQWLNRSGAAQTSNQGTAFNFPSGMQSEFRISALSTHPALRAFVSVDVSTLSGRNAEIVSLNSAELRLRDDDFEKLTAGELLTRVFWIPFDLSEVGENLIMVSDDARGLANRGTIVATWKMSVDAKKVLTTSELPSRP